MTVPAFFGKLIMIPLSADSRESLGNSQKLSERSLKGVQC